MAASAKYVKDSAKSVYDNPESLYYYIRGFMLFMAVFGIICWNCCGLLAVSIAYCTKMAIDKGQFRALDRQMRNIGNNIRSSLELDDDEEMPRV